MMNKIFNISCREAVILLVLLMSFRVNSVHVITVDSDADHVNIGRSCYVFIDDAGRDFDYVVKNEHLFELSKESIPGYGFTEAVVWVKFRLTNNTDSEIPLLLEYGYPMVDELSLYSPDLSNVYNYTVTESGIKRGFRSREVLYRNITFLIEVPPFGEYDYYLRVRTDSSVNIPLSIRSYKYFAEKVNTELMFLGAFYGIMVVMFLYNLFLFLSLKDINYLYYLFWIICATMVQFSLNGFSSEYLWNEYSRWSKNNIAFFMMMGGFWGITFAQVFLSTQKASSMIHSYLNVVRFFALAGVFIALFFSYKIAIRYATVLWLVIPVTMLFVSSFFFLKGYRPARFFIISWTTGFIGMGLFAAKSLNLVPNNLITIWGMQFGVGIEGLLLSIGLGDKINEMKREQLRAQQLLLDTKITMLESFSRFVPKQFLTFLQKESIEDIELGDATSYKMTVLFSDIRDFTNLSETMTADENFKFLNSYLKRMEPIIQSHAGFVDKFIGDAIMALFPDNAQEALLSAVEIQKELKIYNSERELHGYADLSIGIGLNSGELMLGTVGSEKRLDTTVIGDTVNLASRIEGLTKIYKVFIIITENTYNELTDRSLFDIREIDIVKVKGKKEHTKIFEVYNGDNRILKEQKKESIIIFNMAVSKYRDGNFHEASELFKECKKIAPGDTLPLVYLQRCEYLLNFPPQKSWDGVSEITIK